MKDQLVLASIVIFSSFSTALFATTSPPVPAGDVRELFVPVGFDDNDDIIAVVAGYLDGVCYKLRQPNVDVDLPHHKVRITVNSVRVHEFCHPIAVRFNQVVHLGTLAAGTYQVETQGEAGPQSLVVKRAVNPGPDDYPYAAVESLRLILGTQSEMSVALRGHYTDTCQKIDDVKVTHHGATIEVLPILKLATRDEDGKPCQNEERSYEKRVDLPQLTKGRYLLHVRSMSGQSLNEVFDFPYPWDDKDF